MKLIMIYIGCLSGSVMAFLLYLPTEDTYMKNVSFVCSILSLIFLVCAVVRAII